MGAFLYATITALAAFVALIFPPLNQQAKVLGLYRNDQQWENVHGLEVRAIPDTVACEDLHYHEASEMLYTACNLDLEKAAGWFPGASSLEHPENPAHGTLVLINPKTLESQKLKLENFEGPFVTHGISLYSPPSDPKTVYVFAVNHLPNPAWTPTSTTEGRTASQIELFVHKVGSGTAKHLRSIRHPLIGTPNDILALSEREFLVTNDHYYREEPLWRLVEEFARHVQSWTYTLRVRLGENDEDEVDAKIAIDSIPTNNGLGWGPDKQVLLSDAVGGGLYFANLSATDERLKVSHRVQIDAIVDNPKYFADPYAGADGGEPDYSGYLMPGIANGAKFVHNYLDPAGQTQITSHVWFLPKAGGRDAAAAKEHPPKLLFSDDGNLSRGATTAHIVAIDPKTNEGKREGWLFVAGVIAPHILATRIDFAKSLA